MTIERKVCVVTGASSGIGRRLALELAASRAQVCVTARRAERLADLVREMGGPPHTYFAMDVSVRKDVKALAAHVSEAHGRCDVLVNNAGFSAGGYAKGDGLKDLREVMATNFFGAAYCVSALLPLLEASAPSNIVNVASVAGRIAIGSSAYVASKFALVGWSECLDQELAPRGVRVSLVEPGLIPTEGFPQSQFRESRLLRHALGTEDEVAAAILAQIEDPKVSRTVPRWYYLLRIPVHFFPPLVRVFRRNYGRP